jgi:hypothetical protein
MTTDQTVVIPHRTWCEQGFRMLQAVDQMFTDEKITFSQPHGIGTDVTVTFSSAEAATMMRLVWSEHGNRC